MSSLRHRRTLDDRLVAAEIARERRWTLLAIALFVVALGLVLFDCGNVDAVHADDRPTAVQLARACVGEAGLDVSVDECTAIGHVLLERGARYSAAIRTCRQPWVCSLGDDELEPLIGWPSELAWQHWRPKWNRVRALARAIVAGSERHRCVEDPDHFGSAEDAPRAWRAGWRPVICGRTRNWFWVTR